MCSFGAIGWKAPLFTSDPQREKGINNYLVIYSSYPITTFIILKTQIWRNDPLPATGVATLAWTQDPLRRAGET